MEFKSIHYSKHAEYLNQIRNEREKIRSSLVYVGFDYSNMISGKFSNSDFNTIHHSIIMRLACTLFHYELLSSIYIHNQPRKYIKSRFPLPSQLIANKQDFVFDSLIFNIVSLFDYLGCLVSFIVRNKKKDQLKAIANYLRAQDSLGKESLGKLVIKTYDNFFSKVNDYRSDLIHYSDDKTLFSQEINHLKNTITFQVYALSILEKSLKKNLNYQQKSLI